MYRALGLSLVLIGAECVVEQTYRVMCKVQDVVGR